VEYSAKEETKKVKLIDIPGSERMRLGELEKYKVLALFFFAACSHHL